MGLSHSIISNMKTLKRKHIFIAQSYNYWPGLLQDGKIQQQQFQERDITCTASPFKFKGAALKGAKRHLSATP